MESNKQKLRPSSHGSGVYERNLEPAQAEDMKVKSVTFETERCEGANNVKRRKNRYKRQHSKSASFDQEDREERRKADLKQWFSKGGHNSGNAHDSLQSLMLRHMSSVDDVVKLKNFQYEEYVDGLMEKIERQRRDIQRKTDELMKEIELQKLKEREAAHHLKIKKLRSSARNDNTFLDNLQKTRMHRISALERKLWNEGKLRTIEDSERFWNDITKPDNLSSLFGSDQIVDRESQTAVPFISKVSSLTYQQDLDEGEDEGVRDDSQDARTAMSLELIREDTEPAIREASAGRKQEQRKVSLATVRRKHPKVIEFEQKFKKVEFPQLSAFTLNLEPPQEDPDVSKLRTDFKHRASLRQLSSKRLNKMYQMSLTHLAATKRMLDQNEELATILRGPDLSDVVFGIDQGQTGVHLRADNNDLKKVEKMDPLKNSISPVQIIEDIDEDDDDEEEEETHELGQSDELCDEMKEIAMTGPLAPLTLDALMETTNVVQANRTGVFWHNYGKFLPSIAT